MSDDLTTYTGHLAELFARVATVALGEEILQRAAGGEVTPALLAVLECIHRRGTCSVGEVARGLGISYAAGSQFVLRLETKGLLIRGEDEHDRRRSPVRLTAAGAALVRAVAGARAERLAGILDGMPADDRLALVRGLEGFLMQVLHDAGSVERLCHRCRIPHTPECVVNRASVALTGEGVKGAA